MEKRQYQRLSKSIQIKYKSHGNIEGMLKSTFTRDISAGGFMIRTDEKLTIGEKIEMKFYVGTEEFIPAKVQVVRVEDVVPNRIYNIGMQIVEIKDEDEKILMDYLEANSEK
ncbi:MAG: PilZ domain-containing protein [Spirochaetales bacterium]|nr:PilZ domain-containing protein [Spirochaetales bacterium]